jgi:hypothetical protein
MAGSAEDLGDHAAARLVVRWRGNLDPVAGLAGFHAGGHSIVSSTSGWGNASTAAPRGTITRGHEARPSSADDTPPSSALRSGP